MPTASVRTRRFLTLDQDERRVTHWTRDGDAWSARRVGGNEAIHLAGCAAELPLDEVYETVLDP